MASILIAHSWRWHSGKRIHLGWSPLYGIVARGVNGSPTGKMLCLRTHSPAPLLGGEGHSVSVWSGEGGREAEKWAAPWMHWIERTMFFRDYPTAQWEVRLILSAPRHAYNWVGWIDTTICQRHVYMSETLAHDSRANSVSSLELGIPCTMTEGQRTEGGAPLPARMLQTPSGAGHGAYKHSTI